MPSITFPADAFRQNIMDYTREVRTAGVDACYWRELLQNARDAGASRVDATVTVEGSVTTVVFTDNGRGMSKDVLVNGMLTYAGSVKPTGAAGGFGMAKCLLVFAPNSVKIETNELAVQVCGINYEWLEVAKPLFGTRFTAVIDNANYPPEKQITPTVEGLRFLMARCDMGDMRVYCNGERIYDTKLPGDAVAVREWAEFKTSAYHLPRSRSGCKNRNGQPVMVIQHRGIWVMDEIVSEEVKGAVWVNICEEPRKVLNAARVSVASYDLRALFGTFLGEIARSPRQSLKTKKWTRRFDGCMTTISTAKEAARAMTAQLKDAMRDAAPGGKTITTRLAVDNPAELLREIAATAFTASGGNTGFRLPAEMLDVSRLNIDHTTANDEVAEKVAALVWAPAMMVVNEREDTTTVHPQWLPETMGTKAKRLLTVWSEFVKQFLILSKAYGCTFGVGFIFCDGEDKTLAQWRKEDDGTVWFLLNPLADDGKMRFNLSEQADRAVMISEAAHEVCHEICKYSHHGDEFANRLTDLMSLALTHSETMNRIWKIRPAE